MLQPCSRQADHYYTGVSWRRREALSQSTRVAGRPPGDVTATKRNSNNGRRSINWFPSSPAARPPVDRLIRRLITPALRYYATVLTTRQLIVSFSGRSSYLVVVR